MDKLIGSSALEHERSPKMFSSHEDSYGWFFTSRPAHTKQDEFKSSGLNITTTACSQRLNPHQPLMLFNVAEMLYNGAEIESALVLSSPEDLQN